MYEDEDFADLFPSRGQLADAPWRLALVTFMQYAKGLTDCQAADAIRTRIDWKYVLSSLELTDSGFDFSVLSEFRGRMLVYGAERRLFDQLLDIWRERGWIKSHGKQWTASTYVLAAIRTLRRLEGVGKTMRHALNVLAEVAPSWLLSHMDQEWVERYEKRFSDFRLPKEEKKRVDLAERIGTDGRRLLELVYADSRFLIDWQAKQVVCPAGHTSRDWDHIPDRHGKPSLRVHFPLRLCRSCPLHAHCTPIAAEALILRPDEASYNAHQQARSRQTAPDFRSRYAVQELKGRLPKPYARVRCDEHAILAAKSSGCRHLSRLQPSMF